DGYNGEVIVSPAPSLPNSGGETAASVTFSNISDTYSEDPDAHCTLESRGAYVGNCALLNAAERYVAGNSPAGMDIARLPASRGGHLGAGFFIDDVSGLRAVNTVAFAHYYNIATIDGPECDFAQLKGDEHGELAAGNSVGIYIAGASRGCNFLS